MAHTLYDPRDIVEMFPHESSDPRVLRNRLVTAVWATIVGLWTLHRHIVDVRCRNVRDFVLENEGDVVVENGYRIRPAHRKRSQTVGAKRRLERRQVPRFFGQLPFVVANKKVQRCPAGPAGELFREVFWDWWYP